MFAVICDRCHTRSDKVNSNKLRGFQIHMPTQAQNLTSLPVPVIAVWSGLISKY